MISLRRNSTFLLLLAFPMIAGHVAAQGFEGTITMTVVTTFGGGASGSITTASRGDRTVTTLRLLGTGAGSLAGGVLRTIIDRGANTLTTLTPMPSGIPM